MSSWFGKRNGSIINFHLWDLFTITIDLFLYLNQQTKLEQTLSAFKCRFSIFYISLFCQSIVLLFWAQCFINVVDNISVNIYRGPYNNRGAGGNTLKISGNRWFLCGSCVTHYRQPWHQLFFLPCSTKNGLKNVTKYFQPYFFFQMLHLLPQASN